MQFGERLRTAILRRGNPVLVGLDPRVENLPPSLAPSDPTDPARVAAAFRDFCLGAIDAVAELVAVVKPQVAFFEQWGPHGMGALVDVIRHAQQRGLLVIADGKRNDIGSTALAYAQAWLGENSVWGADALTVSPYLGGDSLEPFVQTCHERNAGIFVLVKTSNSGGGRFQDVISSGDGESLFERVANLVQSLAKADAASLPYGSIGAVVGATYPLQLAELRARMPNAWLLVPGYGSQGGTARDVPGAFDKHGLGAIINNSRGLTFAYERAPYREQFGAAHWQDAIAAATRDMIAELAKYVPGL